MHRREGSIAAAETARKSKKKSSNAVLPTSREEKSMGTMSEISALLDEVKSCGNTLLCVASELRELISSKEPDAEEQPKAKTTRRKKLKPEETPPPDTADVEEVPQETQKPVTLDEVRAALAEKSRAGYTANVKALIAKYGADKLSDVDPANYAALLQESEVIGNA